MPMTRSRMPIRPRPDPQVPGKSASGSVLPSCCASDSRRNQRRAIRYLDREHRSTGQHDPDGRTWSVPEGVGDRLLDRPDARRRRSQDRDRRDRR